VKTSVEILKKYFGYDNFREGQKNVIDTILSNNDTLGVMPTGAGKSICYQVPALMLDGVTLVISPLISLMKDQIESLVLAGIDAVYVHSGMTASEYKKTASQIAKNNCKIIYVAPERLDKESFINLFKQVDIDMVTIDEAHCVSQWGQDFRPSYLKIKDFIDCLPKRPIVSAFTATATSKVRDDIVSILELKNPYVCVTGFDRKNLFFEVRKPSDKIKELMKILSERRDQSGIIYCSTRKSVEEVCDFLIDYGYKATRYHAGLSDKERSVNQDDFSFDKKPVMVATNAFGMGIDKSNVNYVIHYNMPKNLESYYQEAGRAGRDGSTADCILLYGARDVQMNKFLIEKSHSENNELKWEQRDELIKKDLQLLKEMTFYASTTECLRGYILKYFGEQKDLFCGNCGNCNTTFEEVNISIDSQKIISCVYRINKLGWPYGKNMIADVLKGSNNEKIKNAKFDKLSTYGIMKDVPKRRIIDIIDYLCQDGFLELTDDKYPVVNLNDKSYEIIKGHESIIIKMPKHVEPEIKKDKSTKKTDASKSIPVSDRLFELLRQERRKLADEARVPAFIVFSDATLKDMCRKMPVSRDELLEVSGVGAQKLERYGDAFIEVISGFVKDKKQ
jgi:ATP-dependent DNA helicase RecQ